MTVITCTRCHWDRLITPTVPPNLTADLEDAERQRRKLKQCPRCGDVNLQIERRDLHGQVLLRSL